jgi:hypothetical protein
MIIRARIRLQACTTSYRLAFVSVSGAAHGVAKGPLEHYEVVASSWNHAQRILKHFDVLGHSRIGPRTVDSYTRDIGVAPWGLRKLGERQ